MENLQVTGGQLRNPPVWCGGPIAKLVKLQESFCRRHHVMVPPVKKRFDYHTLILFYKIKSNLAPASLTELLPSPSHNSGHTFRKELYPVPLVKKSSSLSSFFPRSIILWNRRVSHGLGWPANAILFLPIVKGNQKLRNTSAPTVSFIAQ